MIFRDIETMLHWYFLTCAMLFIGDEAFQNVSDELTFVSHETTFVEQILTDDFRRNYSCMDRCPTPRLDVLDCACDDNCLFYGDCCKDYLYYCSDDDETTGNKSLASSFSHQLHFSTDSTKPRWNCITDPESTQSSLEGILAVITCPPSWYFDDIRTKCEVRDVVRQEFVYDVRGYVYANQFCAICNMNISSDNNIIETNSTFLLCDNSQETTVNCSTGVLVEDVSENDIKLRSCSLQLVDTCPREKSVELVFGCSAFMDVYVDGANVYKNHMCRDCYSIFAVILTEPILHIFGGLADTVTHVEEKSKCSENEYYDAVTEECHGCDNGTIVTESEYISLLNNNAFELKLLEPFEGSGSDSSYQYSGNGGHNIDYGIHADEENDRGLSDVEKTVCVTSCKVIEPDDPVDNGRSDEGWVTFTTNDSKLSCRILERVLENVTKQNGDLFSYSKAMNIVDKIVTVISLVALFMSILTLCCFPSLLNLPGICRLCLMISLFSAQLIMLTIAYVTKPESICIVTAAIMHFFWLAMFLWTNVLAFDLARVFGTQSSRPSTSNKGRLLGLYMLYGWGVPLVIISLCLAVHFSGKFDFRYGGESFCWFPNRHSLLYAFGIPVAICIILNFALYIVTVFGIWKVRRVTEFAVRESEKGKKRKDELKLYIKLSILMGLTWSLVFITVYTDEPIIWYVFIILNGLQGFFIFIAFTCNRQTLTKWKDAYVTRVEACSSSQQSTQTRSI